VRVFRRRIRFLPQLQASECGPACLAMLLNHFGRKVTVAEINRSCGVGRGGVMAGMLVEVARTHGVNLKVFSALASALRTVQTPAILHWEFKHWVVLEKWTSTHAIIVDPAMGRQKVSLERFSECFTGIILITDSITPPLTAPPVASRAFTGFFKRAIGQSSILALISLILLAALLGQILGLLAPYFSEILLDKVLPQRMSQLMPVLAVAATAIILSRLVAEYMRSVVLIAVRKRLDAQLVPSLVGHLLQLPYGFFQGRATGDLLNRLNSYTSLRYVVSDQAVAAFIDLLFVVVYVVALLAADAREVPIIAALAALQGIIAFLRYRRLEGLAHRELESDAAQQNALVDMLRGIQHVKATGRERFALAHWRSLFNRRLDASSARAYASTIIDTVSDAVQNATPLLLLWYGAIEVLSGRMSAGMMFTVMFWAMSLMRPILSLVSNAQNLQMAAAYAERLDDILSTQPEGKGSTDTIQLPLRGEIDFRDVSFRYPGERALALCNINLQIRPGEKLAIVGRTGSGKTTLLMLLLGFYRCTSGTILVDGIPLEEWDLQCLRRQIGTVLQDETLFAGSVWNNLTLGYPEAQIDDVIHAAITANIHEDISKLPIGYETYVSENGRNFSGGQKQRLALARALISNPRILLLDEATSHLDLLTESAIDRALNRISCTRLIIAHRLSTVITADRIIVLDQGRIAECGSHEELLQMGGEYSSIYASMDI